MHVIDVDRYIACPACDLLHRRSDAGPGTTARCTRCHTILYRKRRGGTDRGLAFVLAGFIFLLISNGYPFISLEIEGRIQDTILITGVLELWGQGQEVLAVLVLLTGIIFPLLQLSGLIYILVPLRLGAVPPFMAVVYRWVRHIQPWSMMEIMMLGILVSLVKLTGMASVVPGPALFAFMILILLLPAALVAVDTNSIWQHTPIQQDV